MTDSPLLPTPPIGVEVDLRNFPDMPLDVARLAQSWIAYGASAEAFRCAVLLWGKAWHQLPSGSLPDDDILLAQYAGFGRVVDEWKKVRDDALHGFFKCDDGRLYHPVIVEKALKTWHRKREIEAERAAERERKRVLRELRGRNGEGGQLPLSDGKSDLSGGQLPFSGGQSPSVPRTNPVCPAENALKFSEGKEREGSPSGFADEKPSGERRAPARASPPGGGSRLSPDFSVCQEWIEEAREARAVAGLPPAALALEAEKFKNHYLAKAGRDGRMADWRLAWINWALNARALPASAGLLIASGAGPPADEGPIAHRFGAAGDRLLRAIGTGPFRSWVLQLRLDRVHDGTVHLAAPSRFIRNWVMQHYGSQIAQCWGVDRVEIAVRPQSTDGPADAEAPAEAAA